MVKHQHCPSNGSIPMVLLGMMNPLQLDPSMGGNGDTIECVITVQDGFGGVATDTASHVIQNHLLLLTRFLYLQIVLMPAFRRHVY